VVATSRISEKLNPAQLSSMWYPGSIKKYLLLPIRV
jgi:hypothetical protein